MNMFLGVILGVTLATITMVMCCPPPEDLAPHCHCRLFSGNTVMSCEGVLSPEDLVAPLRSISMRDIRVFSLDFIDSSLQYIPHGIFERTEVEKVRFLNTEVMSLSDTDVAFRGLEDTLVKIQATEAEYIASWDWQQLRNLKNLEEIDVNQIVMGSVDEPFPKLPSLIALGITKAGISRLVEGAFTGLPGLRTLSLFHNSIKDVQRNMLPDPADRLLRIDMSDNQLSSLPEDFFSGMPALEIVNLDNNRFVTLNERSFGGGVLGRINEISMGGNPIRCDCRLRWLASVRRVPSHFNVSCWSPESLRGRQLRDLDLNRFWC